MYRVDRQKLNVVEENSLFDKNVSMLHPVATVRNEGQIVIDDVSVVKRDAARNLFLNGRKLTAEQLENLDYFLKNNNLTALSYGYPQDTMDPVATLLTYFSDKLPGYFSGLKTETKASASSAFYNDDIAALAVTGVARGLMLPFKAPKGERAQYFVPGEISVKGQHDNVKGGIKFNSVFASNLLLKALLEYTPIRQPDGTLKYLELTVYGHQIVDAQGKFNKRSWDAAVAIAEKEEGVIQKKYEAAKSVMNVYCESNSDLIPVRDLILEHVIFDKISKTTLEGGCAHCLSTARATAVLRDLPLVLSGHKELTRCPLLLDTIVWCGNPELSALIKKSLQAVISQQDLKDLIFIHAKSDDLAHKLQNSIDLRAVKQEYEHADSLEEKYAAAERYYYAALKTESPKDIEQASNARKAFDDSVQATEITIGSDLILVAKGDYDTAMRSHNQQDKYRAAKAWYVAAKEADDKENMYFAAKAWDEAAHQLQTKDSKAALTALVSSAKEWYLDVESRQDKSKEFAAAKAWYEVTKFTKNKQDQFAAAKAWSNVALDHFHRADCAAYDYATAKSWYEASIEVCKNREAHISPVVSDESNDLAVAGAVSVSNSRLASISANEFLHVADQTFQKGGNPQLLAQAVSWSASNLAKANKDITIEEADYVAQRAVYKKLSKDPTTKKVASQFLMTAGVVVATGLLVTGAVVAASVLTGGTLPVAIAAAIVTKVVIAKVIAGVVTGGALSGVFSGIAMRYTEKKKVDVLAHAAKEANNNLSKKTDFFKQNRLDSKNNTDVALSPTTLAA